VANSLLEQRAFLCQPRQGQINFLHDLAVANFNSPRRDGSDFRIMSYQHNRATFRAQFSK